MKGIGILPGYRISYVDHLVPLCQIMGIPILVTNRWIQSLIELYYPPMEVILSEPESYSLDEVLCNYDTFFYVDHYRLGHGAFQFAEYVTRHKARSVYSLHGNSDKNRNIFWIERLADEDIILLYGKHMIDFYKAKAVENRINHLIECGNYRLEFYNAHRFFFDNKLQLPKKGKTLLYAPTWTSPNLKSERRFDYSSFFKANRWVFESIPEHLQVIVKLHPHLVFLFPEMATEIKESYQNHPQIHFLDDCPLIYSLLNQVDIYLGDYSSIGYDFLYFNRPMFFLSDKEPTFLHRCGISLEERDFSKLYEKIEKEKPLREIQREIYTYTFGGKKHLLTLKEEIEEALCAY